MTTETTHPDTGTLAEIGAQVGDVVRCQNEDGEGNELTISCVNPYRGGFIFGTDRRLDERRIFRMIRRASQSPKPSPVELVKRIKPGTYGALNVTNIDQCQRYIDASMQQCVFTRPDIVAIIATLTEIHDAMKE